MFNPDQPIQSYKEDALNRVPFARSFAEAILNYTEKECLVLGLFGAWGSGKTSIINMVLEHILASSQEKSGEEKPIIVNFNPWNYADQNQLITQFFKEFSVQLKRIDHASNAKKLGKKIETYSELFDPLVLIPTAGPIFKMISVLLGVLGHGMRGWGEAKSKDLETLKKELNAFLDKQKNKIIIVIDDIDRLSDVEIRHTFQLIKSVGDFHNTIYVLAFDKNVVSKALDRLQEGQGLSYLEKVVQVPFEVPLISKQRVEQLLLSQLNELVSNLPKERIDPVRWGNIYHAAFKYFFRNIRDVNRYLNQVKFSWGLVKDELDIAGFLVFTAIQVFAPTIYYGIRDNKELFSGVFESSGKDSGQEKEQAKRICDEIISNSTTLPEEKWKELLIMLFPKLEAIYSNVHYGSEFLNQWRREGRICSPDIFDTFFRLSIQEGDISRIEIENILSLAEDSDKFSEALLKLNEDGRIIRFLERLEDYTRDAIPLDDIESIITVLIDTGDLFPEGDTGFLSTRPSMRILRLLYQLSHRFDSKEERFKIFKNAIKRSNRSLYPLVNEISVQGQQHGKYGLKKHAEPDERLTVNAKQLEQLEQLACNRIIEWAKDGRLAKHRELPSILFRWKEWGNQDDVIQFVNQVIQDDDGLVVFITSFLSPVTSQGVGSYVGRTNWHINLKSIGNFIDVKKIESRLRNIISTSKFENLDEQQKLAVTILLDTIDGKIKDPYKDIDEN